MGKNVIHHGKVSFADVCVGSIVKVVDYYCNVAVGIVEEKIEAIGKKSVKVRMGAVVIATYFAGTEIREFIFLSERMCDSNPHISWITSRTKCDTEEEFLKRIDDKIKNQIENRK